MVFFFPRDRKGHLTVEAEQQQHDEEEDCPDCRKRHHGYSLGVSDEGQAGTCRGGVVGWGGVSRQRGGGGDVSIRTVLSGLHPSRKKR